jgi:hypothetical protein
VAVDAAEKFLAILDDGCASSRFPMLDNGYVYLAATRLSLFRSEADWALVFEVFGFSPRAGIPDLSVATFASRLHHRDPPENYKQAGAYERYLARHPHDDFRSFYPIEAGDWQDPDDAEVVARDASTLLLRGMAFDVPAREEIADAIELKPLGRQIGSRWIPTVTDEIQTYELIRYIADEAREQVLATPEEQRISVRPEMTKLLQLEEWNHPDVVENTVRPSGSETFQQIARVLETGDVGRYAPTLPPNTHWRNWPAGGTL